MTARNLPASLTRKASNAPISPKHPISPSGKQPERIVLYLAVPDPRAVQLLQRSARVFASRRSPVPLELRIFHAPNLPNTPFDDLALLGTLTELGDVEGLTYVTVKPEDLRS